MDYTPNLPILMESIDCSKYTDEDSADTSSEPVDSEESGESEESDESEEINGSTTSVPS